MISSAVIVPQGAPTSPTESERQLEPASPSLKRRQSCEPSSPDNKRPRLDTSSSTGPPTNATSPPTSAVAASPPRRKSAIASGAEEKKRGQRLFGGLLSTLSQSKSAHPSSKKRDEIELRQRERLKRDAEERAEDERRKREELDARRRIEQVRWEKQTREVRWNNMRATAGFLRTQSKPRIYWKPWELRPEEERRIERQKEEVEESIRREKGEDGDRPDPSKRTAVDAVTSAPENGDTHVDGQDSEENISGVIDNGIVDEPEKADGTQLEAAGADAQQSQADQIVDDRSVHDDNGDDQLIEGHDEDQVIY
jgi:hypothetical protein